MSNNKIRIFQTVIFKTHINLFLHFPNFWQKKYLNYFKVNLKNTIFFLELMRVEINTRIIKEIKLFVSKAPDLDEKLEGFH
jgi:hypothetical protein